MTSLNRLQNRLQIRTIIIGVVLIPLTALSVYFIYGDYLFSKWPWMRFSVLMATLTCLWTYTFWFARVTGGDEDTLNTFYFVLIAVPFDVLLMYPDTQALGIGSDRDMYTLMFVLQVIHGFGFYFIQREIQKYLYDLTNG